MFDVIMYSKNVLVVWMLNEIGVEIGKFYLKVNGIDIFDEGFVFVLGGLEKGVLLFQFVGVFYMFVVNGMYIELYFIFSIKDEDGEIIVEYKEEGKWVFSK